MAIEKVEKQPGDTLPFDIDFGDWLDNRGETAASATATVAAGITLVSTTLIGTVVRVKFSGGTTGTTYKCTITLTTASGAIKEYDFNIRVKEQ